MIPTYYITEKKNKELLKEVHKIKEYGNAINKVSRKKLAKIKTRETRFVLWI